MNSDFMPFMGAMLTEF